MSFNTPLCAIEKQKPTDKSFQIWVGDGLSFEDLNLTVDYDNVNHPEVDASVRAMVEILEKYRQEYTDLRNKYISEIPKCKEHQVYFDEYHTCWACEERLDENFQPYNE